MLHQSPASDKKNQRKFKSAAEKIWKTCWKRFEKTIEKDGKLIIAISGESGSGKSSIAYYLCKLFMEESERKSKELFNNIAKKNASSLHTEIYNFSFR
jgi:ABC-type dipeptide/oligopeptide/nickel transport system ATPase subunit